MGISSLYRCQVEDAMAHMERVHPVPWWIADPAMCFPMGVSTWPARSWDESGQPYKQVIPDAIGILLQSLLK